MGLEVQYEEIRANVIPKLGQLQQEMEETLQNLESVVGSVSLYLEGDAQRAYEAEFDQAIRLLFQQMNRGMEQYTAQLESVCAEFEAQDQQVSSMLNFSI